MATNPLGGASAPVTLPGTIPPMPAVARILSRYDRDKLAAFVSVAIDLLDVLDGDADDEPCGDEQDGNFAEDDVAARFANMGQGPGCIVSDFDRAVDDSGCDEDFDAEPEYPTVPDYGLNQDSPPQQPELAADRANMRPHLERIRRSRCDRTRWGYVLREVDSEPGESA